MKQLCLKHIGGNVVKKVMNQRCASDVKIEWMVKRVRISGTSGFRRECGKGSYELAPKEIL